MSAVPVCHRHPRKLWIANCPDCTAWHLAKVLAYRDRKTTAA